MSNELATTDAFAVANQISQLKELGSTLVKSGLLPAGIKSAEAAVVIILKGRELGLPPMQALSHVHVVNGKPTLSAEVMLAMALQRGHRVVVAESTNERATVKGQRLEWPGQYGPEQSLTFSMEDARTAGVTGNPTWKKYPAAMLRARAISAFMRMFAPDVLMGASYVPEELGAEVNEDGEVVRVDDAQDVEFTPAQPEPSSTVVPAEPLITGKQVQALAIAIGSADFGTDEDGKAQGRAFVAWLANRAGVLGSIKDLTASEANTVLDRLGTGENGSYRTDEQKLAEALNAWHEHLDITTNPVPEFDPNVKPGKKAQKVKDMAPITDADTTQEVLL